MSEIVFIHKSTLNNFIRSIVWENTKRIEIVNLGGEFKIELFVSGSGRDCGYRMVKQ